MIHIILDANIYRQAPRLDSTEFKTLSYMVRKLCIRLHIPFVVEREFTSFLEIDQRKKLASAAASIRKALHYEGKGQKSTELAWALEKLNSEIEEIVGERSAAFIAWLSRNNVDRHPVTLEQSQKALEAYFTGQPPLKEPKIRNDIPDSFIFQKILELQSSHLDALRVVTEDGALRNACCQQGIVCFSSLSSLLASEEAKECLKQKLIDENKPQILEHVRSLVNSEIRRIGKETESLLLSGEYDLISGSKIPGENQEISICASGSPFSINVDQVEYFGGGLFVAYFSAKVEFDYSYPVSIMDSVDLNREKYSFQPLNDHYVEVETSDEFLFSGQAELGFSDEILNCGSIERLLAAMKDPEIQIGNLDDFEVEWLPVR